MSARKRNNTRHLNAAVDDCVAQFGVPEPGVFLAHLMAGVDPRAHSPLLTYLKQLCERYKTDPPPPDAWARVRELVDVLPPLDIVDVEMSAAAARALMPYLYAKRKDIEVHGSLTTNDLPPVNLTEELAAELIEKIKGTK